VVIMSILECKGQDRAILRLQRARQSARVPHGYIFFGPEGVGKGLLARQWAKLLLCGQPIRRSLSRSDIDTDSFRGESIPPDGKHAHASMDMAPEEAQRGAAVPHSPFTSKTQWLPPDMVPDEEIEDCCDQCGDCKLVEAGTHPDLHIIDKDLGRYTRQKRSRQLLNLPIDVIREYVIEPAGSCPSRGRARVFIIEQAESMSTAAQNALLKTLEEPPPSTFLILISSQPQRFLATINSRCQSVRFVPLASDFVREKLIEAGVAEDEAQYWADFCGGRLGVGLRLARMELYERKCLIIKRLTELSYVVALELAGDLVDSAKDYAQKLLKENPGNSPSDAERQGQFHWLEILIHAFSLALGIISRPEGREMQFNDQVESIEKLAARYGALGCSEAIRSTYRARGLFGANVNPTLIFESLMLEYLGYTSASVV
jgi:DNA polymerase III delta prime subunit